MDVKAWMRQLREELAVCDREIAMREKFVQRKQAVEAALGSLQLLDEGATADQSVQPVVVPFRPSGRLVPNSVALWMGAQEILRDWQRPAGVPELVAEMRQRGWKMTVNAREIVRTQVLRKGDVFERVA